jgi:HAE1 family hydrophobic/amphiphilic exporter-1
MLKIKQLEKDLFDKVNPAVKFSVSRYVLAIGLFAAIFGMGVISITKLGVASQPSMNLPMVVVLTNYPGATPTVVNEQLTKIIENAIATASGITEINSTSSRGQSMVTIQFEDSVDKNSAINQVSSLVSAVASSLPSAASTPTIQSFDPNSEPVIQFGLSGGERSLSEVGDYVDNELSTSLQHIAGVASVSTSGASERQFQVLLNPNMLKYYNLNPSDVVAAIGSSSVNDSIGSITIDDSVMTFATKKLASNLEDIRGLLVDSARGVRVEDLGSVRDSSSAETYARVDGRPVILVSIKKNTDANSVSVAKNVRELLSQTQLPAGYAYTISKDSTVSISASVNSTVHELVITLIIVAIIVMLFIGKLNTVFSVILSIPIALSAAPIMYLLFGYTLNMVSLLAMIVAIGVVVDDAIVVAENVERYRVEGQTLKDSVLRGTSEVFSAVVAASLSILAVLVPVSFLGGMVGSYIKEFAGGLIAAVLLSLFDAILFLTVRLAYLPDLEKGQSWAAFAGTAAGYRVSLRWGLKAWRSLPGLLLAAALALVLLLTRRYWFLPALLAYPLALAALNYAPKVLIAFLGALTESLHVWTERLVGAVRDGYARLLARMLGRSGLVLVGILLAMAAIVAIVIPKISFSFMPQTDDNSVSVQLELANGSPLATTNAAVSKIEAYLKKQAEVVTIQALVGESSRGISTTASNKASISVTLLSSSKRQSVFSLIPIYRSEILKLLADLPAATVMVSAGGGMSGQGSAFTLNLVSSSLVDLNEANAKAVKVLRKNVYVQDLRSSLADTTSETDFVPDDAKLRGTGITATGLSRNLQICATGSTASSVTVKGFDYPIVVKLDGKYLTRGRESLASLPIYSPSLGSSLLVGQLGDFRIAEAPVSISRFNKLYTAELTISPSKDAPPIMAFQGQLDQELKSSGILGQGVSLSSGSSMGQAALARQLMSSGIMAFLLAFALAYLVMAAQFNSWRYPVYLMLPVPLAIVGALIVVAITGGAIDIFGVMGMLLLIGLSAKNAILYLDFVVERVKRMSLREALLESAVLRFRPILMTTLTVLVISGPLVFGSGEGSEFGKSLGTVMFGGIVFSAILTFFVVPTAFQFFERKRAARGTLA